MVCIADQFASGVHRSLIDYNCAKIEGVWCNCSCSVADLCYSCCADIWWDACYAILGSSRWSFRASESAGNLGTYGSNYSANTLGYVIGDKVPTEGRTESRTNDSCRINSCGRERVPRITKVANIPSFGKICTCSSRGVGAQGASDYLYIVAVSISIAVNIVVCCINVHPTCSGPGGSISGEYTV